MEEKKGVTLGMRPKAGELWSRQPNRGRFISQRGDQLGLVSSYGNFLTRSQSVFKLSVFKLGVFLTRNR